MAEEGHDPEREATQEQIEGDERARRESEPFEGGYGAEWEEEPNPTTEELPDRQKQ